MKTHDVARQLRRAALSTSSNYRAACRAKSRRDFISKMATVLEEVDEAQGWLETLDDCRLVDAEKLPNCPIAQFNYQIPRLQISND
jgi:four helix bundle protein